MNQIQALQMRVRALLVFFIAALLAAGLTAFPLEWELGILDQIVRTIPVQIPPLIVWVSLVNRGIQETYRNYPFLAYGTDWLAFAHIVIAIAFVGPLKNPVRNIWVIEWGMIACVLVIPLAVIMNPIRGIPFFWTLVDCSFGVFGIIPLWFVRRDILRLAELLKGNF
ncbi:MAG: hypothetical protein HY868_19580 [Chloroflexi bacterium]|nr:hypothetical protein [Chloroflexota bacterium]